MVAVTLALYSKLVRVIQYSLALAFGGAVLSLVF